MRKRTFLKISLALLSLLLALLMMSSCTFFSILFQSLGGSRQLVDFDKVTYTRPDFDAIAKALDEVKTSIEDSASQTKLKRQLSNAYLLINDAQTQYTVAEIRYYENVTESYYNEEMTYCSEKLAGVQKKLNEVYQAIIDADMAKTLLPSWTERDYESFERNKKLYDDEYETLMARRTELENTYLNQSTEITFSLNDKEYTVSQLIDDISSGAITYEQYIQGLQSYYQTLNRVAGPIYLELLAVDKKLAAKLGEKNLTEYYYADNFNRSYTSEDVHKVWAYTKEYLVPLYRSVSDRINTTDLTYAMASGGQDAIDTYNDILWNYAKEISPDMEEALKVMSTYHLSSIGSSPNRQNSSFTTMLPSYVTPFLFVTTQGNLGDVSTFVHEFGHFYSFYKNGFEIDQIMDVEEIQSQANEWLFMDHYTLEGSVKQAWLLHKLSDSLNSILQGCLMDEFQQYAYGLVNADDGKEGVDVTVAQLNQKFARLVEEYGLDKDFSMIPYETLWCEITHTFIAPFYYVSYAMSAIPSLEIYALSRSDRKEAIRIYNNVVDETGYRTFEKVLEDNGLSSPFEKEAYEKITELVNDLLKNTAEPSTKTQ